MHRDQHLDVEKHQIGTQFQNSLNGPLSILGFSDDFDAIATAEHYRSRLQTSRISPSVQSSEQELQRELDLARGRRRLSDDPCAAAIVAAREDHPIRGVKV
jgi:hypothetical protein